MTYNIAIYIRLSLADTETGYSKAESDSVIGQRTFLNNFLNENKEFSNCNRTEFVDDGFSGTSDNRPSFIKMMELVKTGDINLICVRDFSRFFRDYIEAGNYLECVFPFLNVRFISINDNYDSDNFNGTTGGMEMVMRNIVYSYYSRDISIKITSSLEHMMKQGKYVGSQPVYGYILHKTESHKLFVDTNISYVIKKIFKDFLDGIPANKIAISLNELHILTPATYKNLLYDKTMYTPKNTIHIWIASMIIKILRNPIYTGDLVSYTRKKVSLYSKKTVKHTPIIVENTHEAIISKEDFAKVQEILATRKKTVKNYEFYPLKSILNCGVCNRRLRKSKRKVSSNVFICPYCNVNIISPDKVIPKFSEDILEEIVYTAIKQFVFTLKNEITSKNEYEKKVVKNVCDAEYTKKNIESLKQYKFKIYDDYISGTISKELFLSYTADTDLKIKQLNEQLEKVQIIEPVNKDVNNKFNYLIDLFDNNIKLSYELTHSFIEKVIVFDEKNIEIVWKFKDEFTV